MAKNPIICAIDTADLQQAGTLAAQLSGYVGALKLGLEFFTANAAEGVEQIAKYRLPIFLDLKFHDIPNTVSRAIRATAGIDTFMMTVHCAAGKETLRAAVDASMEMSAATGKDRTLMIGVTMLTSLDNKDLAMLGIPGEIEDHVKRLADLAQTSGLDGVVCSAHEIDSLREQCGSEFKLIVPGIRPKGSSSGDQKRVLTPKAALDAGADYLVIGRPITTSPDPAQAAQEIAKSIGIGEK